METSIRITETCAEIMLQDLLDQAYAEEQNKNLQNLL